MNILFVCHNHLESNSGIHIYNLANHLSRLGVECTVCVPKIKPGTSTLGVPNFVVSDFAALLKDKNRKFDFIHAWTPREIVRCFVSEVRKYNPAQVIVHLEDNEEYMIEAYTGIPAAKWRKMPRFLLNLAFPTFLSHPVRFPDFLASANGVTVITESLRRFFSNAIPSEVIWAGYQEEMEWNMPRDIDLRRKLGIADDEFVVVYTGNIHTVNLREVTDLYGAIMELRQRGYAVKLVRTGKDQFRFPKIELRRLRMDHCIELGHVPRSHLPAILSIADALVQPGKPDPFNDYRFPSKLPEYLASGKPVILPKTNIGKSLKDNEECLLLGKGDVMDITQKIEKLIIDESLRKKIGAGGRSFAERNLRWSRISEKLKSFYLTFD